MTTQRGHDSIITALATLKDVAGISGSFAFTREGRLIGRDIHPMFDDATLGDAAERLTRLHETFLAVGDDLEIAVIRFQDHKLYLKTLADGMLCILADGLVNMAALRMAANLVGRRIAGDLRRHSDAAGLVADDEPQTPGPPAIAAAPPLPGTPLTRPPVIAPGTRRFRGHAV